MAVTCLRPDGRGFPASISARLIEYRGEEVVVSSIGTQTLPLMLGGSALGLGSPSRTPPMAVKQGMKKGCTRW